MDGVATAIDRTGGEQQTTFEGRFLGFKDRRTKKAALCPLPNKVATKGKKNLTPESYLERKDHYNKHMKKGAIHMSDSSPGLLKLRSQR